MRHPSTVSRFFIASSFSLFLLAAARPGAAQTDWTKEWEKTLAEAKKEGQVNVYIYRYEPLLRDFKRDFPGINVVSVTGRGNEMTARIMSERRAGKFIADVYSGGSNRRPHTLYKGKKMQPIKTALPLPQAVGKSKQNG